ncbi:hypothetical protein QYH69_16095 [Paraburkholderia sp. SARCC-3016]|uniref:hypothetical protein n=1 Tax=Paraburkholderia sp. SARCC-3016 TaxID=3058611 RepID=UPI0028081EB2|nr:hypothetical protein [Paraburkholderia sp. SARCC-3016]MDQ7978770.1 hypothetical protein [Paraburkholderia sp. SARCC-3016]
MSTNIPFTLVEGAVALPPLRPLGPLSRTLGREWALLPPNVSLRVELKALYAAMLRTFCLSSQAIRSMCRWEPLSAQNDASDAGDAALATAVGALSQRDKAPTVHASSHAAGVAGSPAATAGVKPGARPLPYTPRRTSNLKAGSAVAIGGAAMLAWIVLDHPHREYVNSAAPAAIGAASSRAAQHAEPSKTVAIASVDQAGHAASAGNPSTDLNGSANVETRVVQAATVTNPQPAASPQVVVASQLPSSGLAQAARPALGTATVASGERPITQNVAVKAVTATATTTSIAPVAITSPEAASREAAPVAARRSSTAAATSATETVSTWTARHAAASAETTVSRAASASAKPSAAGNYSPFAPSVTVDGDYESVTASARTYSSDGPDGTTTANIAVQQRTQAMPRSNVDTNDTSWMGRLSQRRVTEVPELFSQ